jgi:hypothetical protein
VKIIDDILYIEYRDFITAGWKEQTVKMANHRNGSRWQMIKNPNDKRMPMVRFDTLADEHKEKLTACFGDPYDYIAKNPIKELAVSNAEDEKFFISYTYGDNKKLSREHIAKYTTAAKWIRLLNKLYDDKKYIKKVLGLSLEQFNQHVKEIIISEKIDLPHSFHRLRKQREEFKENGPISLIDWRFGNKLAAKVNDDFSESLLLELLCNPNQYDDVYISMVYNKAAAEKGYEPITVGTVGVWRRKMMHQIMAKREGWAAFDQKFRRQVPGKRPSAPLFLVESDDNHLDLFFIDIEDESPSGKYYHKYKAIVVVDSFNDYVLGYAYSENLTTELVRCAYANAMYHIRSLTGAWYLPHETRTDNWAKKELVPFYESMGHYVQSPVGSKKRGFIEQFFRTPHWKRCLKMGANNYTGNNITAKTRGVNTEVLNLNKKNYPTVQHDAVLQIENFFHRLRTLPQSNGKSKQEEWLEAWVNTPAKDKKQISEEQFLLLFGVRHNPNGRSITISNKGVAPQINNVQYLYDVPPALSLPNIGKKVNVLYDPYDMSRVLITDDGSLRFVATTTHLAPKALRDYQPGDRTYLNALLAEKGRQVDSVMAAAAKREKVLTEAGVDAESLLIAGVMIKEIKQNAEVAYQSQSFIEDRRAVNPLDQM